LPTHRAMPADDEAPLQDAADEVELAELAEQAGQASTADLFPEPPAVWHRFARGILAGNFLHGQLEWLSGEGFDLAPGGPVAARLRQRCERSAYAASAED